MDSMYGITWYRRYPVDTLQIYFSGSLEIQEELIKHGFQVPMSIDKSVMTPIPLVYSNFRGWIKEPEPVTIERLIPPEWLELNPISLGWKEVKRNGKRSYKIPPEEVYVDIGYDDRNIYFRFDIRGYHLERISIRGVNPEKWNNWAMFYVDYNYYDDLLSLLKDIMGSKKPSVRVESEILQGGKERTYYAYDVPKRRKVGIPVKDFSLCLGCFPLALRYFELKARGLGVAFDIGKIKLRLKYDPSINTGLKVGVAKISGKNPQIMFKLASNTPKEIRGVLKPSIRGKARGGLIPCNHINVEQYIAVDSDYLYSALTATKNYLSRIVTQRD